MRVIAIANQKGGVGKTATAHALAVYAVRDFVRRYESGEIKTQTKKALPDL